ncbi:MAG TPA: hypothetical protein VIU12_10540 [Chryseolinea sp.]
MKIQTLSLPLCLMLSGMLTAPQMAHAQDEPKHSIRLTYGTGTAAEFEDATDEVFEAVLSNGTRVSNTTYSGSLGIQYDYTVSPKFSVGLGLVYETIKKDVTVTTTTDVTYDEGYSGKYTTILASATYSYMSKPKFGMFARVAIGPSFLKEKVSTTQTAENSATKFAYQISPIGIRAGQKLYFHAEAGYGYLGILAIGVGYRFQ